MRFLLIDKNFISLLMSTLYYYWIQKHVKQKDDQMKKINSIITSAQTIISHQPQSGGETH